MVSRISKVREKIHSRADVIIGKNGLTEGVIREIEERLRSREVVKVKLLKASLEVIGSDRVGIARIIAERVNAELVDVRGRTFILYKPKRAGKNL
ncbi:MAG: YhbY family RNA-binding protein [Acidilobaceae archaeon]